MKRRLSDIYSLDENDLINLYNINKKCKYDNKNDNINNNTILEFSYDNNNNKLCSLNNTYTELSFIENVNICNLKYVLYTNVTLKINVSNKTLVISNYDFIAFYINNLYEYIHNINNVNIENNKHILLNILYNLKNLNDINKVDRLKNSIYTKYKTIYDVFNYKTIYDIFNKK